MTDDQRALLATVENVERAVTAMMRALDTVPGIDRQRMAIARVHLNHFMISVKNAITEGIG